MVRDSKDGLDFQTLIKTDNQLAASPVASLDSKAAAFFALNAVTQTVKSAADATKAALDKAAASAAVKAAAKKNAQSKVAAPAKEITIVCQKGKSQLKVIGVKPICPSGYKKTK
jgi:hypothetical protein